MYYGKLVKLRAFERQDLEKNHEFVNDYDTVKGMASGVLFPCSYEDEQRFMDQQSSYTRGEFQFAVENAHGDLVGRCGILKIDWKNSLAELGIMIGTDNRGKGYGSDAMDVLCQFCFEEMNLHKLKLSVIAFNQPALRCYEKCGFVREGVLKSEVFRQGEYHDVVMLGKMRQ